MKKRTFLKVLILLICSQLSFGQYFFSHEFNLQGIYIPSTAQEVGIKTPLYYKLNFESYKKIKNDKIIGVKVGAGPGVFPLVMVADIFIKLFDLDDPINFGNVNTSLTFLYGDENKKFEVGYCGILADKEIFNSNKTYNHGIVAGLLINRKPKSLLSLFPMKKGKRHFFKFTVSEFFVNQCQNCYSTNISYRTKEATSFALSWGIFIDDSK